MTYKEIVQNAIISAEKAGWKNPYKAGLFSSYSYTYKGRHIKVEWDIVEDYEKIGLVITNNHPADESYREVSINHIILSPAFAKALFGEGFGIYPLHGDLSCDEIFIMQRTWQHYLQKLAIMEDKEKLQYLKIYMYGV